MIVSLLPLPFGRSFPIQEIDVDNRHQITGQPHDDAVPVSEIWVTGQILARCLDGGRANALYIRCLLQSLGVGKILDEKLSGFINVGIDFMRRDGPCGKSNSDISADLADPDLVAVKDDWC